MKKKPAGKNPYYNHIEQKIQEFKGMPNLKQKKLCLL